MLLYMAVAALLCFAFDRSVDFRPTLYFQPFFACYLLGIGIVAAVVGVRHAFGRSAEPFLLFPRLWSPAELLRNLICATPFLLAWPLFMAGFTALKTLLNDTVPFTWDHRLADLEKLLHFGKQPWQWLAIENPAVTRAIESGYASWAALLIVVPFAVALRRSDSAARMRFLISITLVFILLGNVAAGSFMSAGPFWFELSGARPNEYAGLFAYLSQANPDGTLSTVGFQRYLWNAHLQGTPQFANGISAFPSVHVAVATLYLLYAWKLGRLPRIAAALFLAAIMTGSVHLGWHYAVDGYAGGLGAALIYAAVGALQRRHARLSPLEAAIQTAPTSRCA